MMAFADVEAMVVMFLATKLGVPVRTRVPNPLPSRFVRVWRSGGAAQHRALDVAQVTVTAWGTDSVDASELAREAQALLLNDHSNMTLVRSATETGGLYYDPDTTGADRYTFTVELRVRRP